MAGYLQHDDFTPHVNKMFRFEGHPEALRLAAIDMVNAPTMPQDKRKPFILIFEGGRDHVLREGLYKAEVEGGGSFELYLMPIHTMAADRQDYQAAFN